MKQLTNFDLAKKFKEYRKIHNITQRELAERLNIIGNYVCQIERRKTPPSLNLIYKFIDLVSKDRSMSLQPFEYLNDEENIDS